MEPIHTLQDYLINVEATVYIILGVYLIGIIGFWHYLSGRNEDEYQKKD